jgi:Tetratricopeptide repeat
MHRPYKTAWSITLLGTLMACAQIGGPPAAVSAGQVRLAAPIHTEGVALADAGYLRGRAAHGLGQWVLAGVHYEQVLALEPGHVGALNGLGVIHAQAGRTDEALALFARAAILRPDAPYLYNNAGYAHLQADRIDEAGDQLRRAQLLDPSSLQTRHNLALWAQARRRAGENEAQKSAPANGSGARLVALAPQIYELQITEPLPAVQLAQTVQSGPWFAPREPVGERFPAGKLPGSRVARSAPAAGPAPVSVRVRSASDGVLAARSQPWPYRQMKTERHLAAGWETLAKGPQKLATPQTPIRLAITSTVRWPGKADDTQLRLVPAQALHHAPPPRAARAT